MTDQSTSAARTGLKGRFPFRLGATSYVVPDDIVPNVRLLAGLVDDVELLLFESDEMTELPGPAVIRQLSHIADANDLTYTVHLPMDISLGDEDEAIRSRSVAKCLKAVSATRELDPFGYVVHVDMCSTVRRETAAWLSSAERSLGELADCGVDPTRFCVETLDYPIVSIEDAVRNSGMSFCVDVGHLVRREASILECAERCGDTARIMHLHGITDEKDHSAVSALPRDMLDELFGWFVANSGTERVVTLEVFGRDDFERSMDLLEEYA